MPREAEAETHDHIQKMEESGEYDSETIGENDVYFNGRKTFGAVDVNGRALATSNGEIIDISDVEEAPEGDILNEEKEVNMSHLGQSKGPTKSLLQKGETLDKEEVENRKKDAGWDRKELKEFMKKGVGIQYDKVEKKLEEWGME